MHVVGANNVAVTPGQEVVIMVGAAGLAFGISAQPSSFNNLIIANGGFNAAAGNVQVFGGCAVLFIYCSMHAQ